MPARSPTGTATTAGWRPSGPDRTPPKCSGPEPAARRAPSPSAGPPSTTVPGRSRTAAPSSTSATRRTRLGAGLVDIPPVPTRDPASAVMAEPHVAGAPPLLQIVRRAGGAQPRRAARTHRGLLPAVRRSATRSPRQLHPGEWSPGSTRSVGCLAHGGLGWIYLARDRQGRRPVGRAQGSARPRRRGRHGRRDGRAAVPGRGRAPEHRQDPQLRRARRRRLHRHGVRQRHQSCRNARGAARGQRRTAPTRSRSRMALAFVPGDPPRARPPARPAARSTATSSRTTSSTPASSLKLIDLGGVYRMDDRTQPALRHGRLTRRRRSPNRADASPRTSSPSGARWPCCAPTSPATRARTLRRCPTRGDVELYARQRVALPASCCGPPPTTRPTRFQSAERDGRPARRRPPRDRGRRDRIAGTRRQHHASRHRVADRRTPPTGGPCPPRSSTRTIRRPP